MPLAAHYDIVLDRGADWVKALTFRDGGGDPLDISDEPAQATLTTAFTGVNNDIVFTAVPYGDAGNVVSVEFVQGYVLAVAVASSAITITFAVSPTNVPNANVDWSISTVYSKTLSGNTTFTFSNVTSGKTIAFYLTQPSAQSWGQNWPSGITWAAGPPGVVAAGTTTRVVLTATSLTTFNGSFSTSTSPEAATTADAVKTALAASASATALVSAADKSGDDGTGIVAAMPATNLVGGVDATAVFYGEVRRRPKTASLATFSFQLVNDGTDGLLTWSLPKSQTLRLFGTGTYSYDIFMDRLGKTTRLIEGSVTVRGNITAPQ